MEASENKEIWQKFPLELLPRGVEILSLNDMRQNYVHFRYPVLCYVPLRNALSSAPVSRTLHR